MNNQEPRQHLSVGQDVTFVGGDGKKHKGKISAVYNENEARIDFENGAAIASYSDKAEHGTFHFEQASPKAEHKKEA